MFSLKNVELYRGCSKN